jgi:cystathionine beta-lyase
MMWNFDEEINRESSDSVKYDLSYEKFGRKDIIPMWVADMDFRTPGFITEKLRERLDHEIYGYFFRSPQYFDSIISWMKTRYDWSVERDHICFSPGTVPALNLCTLTFTRPGESIIVQPPVYYPFFSAVESHGRLLIHNQLKEKDGRWTMDLESLSSAITADTKMIILCNPHNPVGRAWSRDELMELANICLKNKIIILSDEIHCDLSLPGYNHTPLATLSDEIADITVTCIAPSKTFNLAGLSTSSVIISNPVMRKYFRHKMDSLHIGNGNIFGSVASCAAYSGGHEWLDALTGYIEGNVNYVIDYCREFIPEIIPVRPEATYLIWLDCRKLGMTGIELRDFFAAKAGVGLNEGSEFGPGGEGFMRMNVAMPQSRVKKAMQQIEKAISHIP